MALPEVIIHGAKNHVEDDIATPQGGAIEPSTLIITKPITDQEPIVLISDSDADLNQNYLLEGFRDGIQVSEEVRLSGATNSISTKEMVLYKVTKVSGDPLAGTVTISGLESDKTIVSLFPETALTPGGGVAETLIARRLFYKAFSSFSIQKPIYEKFFYRATTPITNIRFDEFVDPADAVIFSLDKSINGDSTAAHRLNRPPSTLVTSFDNKLKTTTSLGIGDAIGVWVRLLSQPGSIRPEVPWRFRFRGVASAIELTLELISVYRANQVGFDVLDRRDNHPIGGGNPNRFMELVGAKVVPLSFFEPDPSTFRSEFYYNTRLNRLFKREKTSPQPVWKIVR